MAEPLKRAEAVLLGIAGIRCGFYLTDPAFRKAVKERYRGFLSPGRPDFIFTVSPAGWKQSPFRPVVSEKGGALRLERGDFKCSLDLRTGHGTLACAAREQTFDSFLRTLFSWLLPRRGGLLLHAAGIVKDGRALVFPGKSGAGKSTLSKLAASAGLRLLSDELVPVLPWRGGYAAYGSPFWGELRRPGSDGRFKLRGLYSLHKARKNSVEPGPAGEMLRRLLRCSMNFSSDASAARRLLAAAAGLADCSPGRLAFSKESPACIDLL